MKKKEKKSTKKGSVNVAQNITNRIPYIRCYEDDGIIEIELHKYSITFEIVAPSHCNDLYVPKIAYNCLSKLMAILKGLTFRFTIRNSVTMMDDYLASIQLAPDKEPAINEYIEEYNHVLEDNVSIGHNNFRTSLYLTIVYDAEVPDDAKTAFDAIHDDICTIFHEMYGYAAKLLELPDRLRLLYDIYHPDVNAPEFGAKVDYNGAGFSIDAMQRMKMTTKDVIAPTFYETKERNYMRIGNKYVRTLFINSLPLQVSDTIMNDLISVSDNAILSVSYQPVDTEFGFQAAARKVKSNIEVKNVAVRDSIEDRKKHTAKRVERMLRENEDEYFNKTALDVLTDSIAEEQQVYLTSFIIVLYADTLEDLERDSKLLKISAAKYACQVKPCDLQQHEAFVTALPLGSVKTDLTRTFPAERLSRLLPINSQSLFEERVMLQGLNIINDNYVLIDRSNYPLGIIAGTRTSGKTFTMKRDIINTLMSTNDHVIIVAPTVTDDEKDDYANLLQNVGGTEYPAIHSDLFTCSENYGVTTSNEIFKAMYLESFITMRIGFHKKFAQTDLDQIYTLVENEAKSLSQFTDYTEALAYANEHKDEFPLFLKSLVDYIPATEYPDLMNGNRMSLFRYAKPSELLMQIDYLFNFAIEMKKINKNVWIYVDGIDEFLYSPATSDYLMALLDKCKTLDIPFTMTLQDAAKVCASNVASIELDYLLDRVNYFKLLSMGVIERRKFVEKLNIPTSLVPYITDREPSEGIIITPNANISFCDKFAEPDNGFYTKL